MLKKLLKYDLKWIYKVLVVFYILSFIFAILGRSFSTIGGNSAILGVVANITNGFCIGMIINIFINNFMRCWARFKINLYGDESYLTHTLPVEKKTIYLSKVISVFITVLTSVIVSLLCLVIMYYSKESIEVIKNLLQSVALLYDSKVISLLLIVSIVFFLEMIFIVLIGYVGMIIGHKSNSNKMVKSIVYGFAMYMLTNGLTLALLFIVGLFNNDIMNLFTTSNVIDINIIKLLMYSSVGIYIIYIIIYYYIGKKQFEKGVNVD